MATVLNRTTKQLLASVNTPDYPTVDWIINPNLSAVTGVPVEYWEITGDVVSEMDAGEKAAVDAVLIVGDKQAKINTWTYTASRISEDKYFSSDMATFAGMLAQAIDAGLTNREAYLQGFFTWTESIQTALDAKIVEVNSKTTRADVAAVTWDTSALVAADPGISVTDALAIPN